jgi:hypothetical protein
MENKKHEQLIMEALLYSASMDGVKDAIPREIAKDVLDLFETRYKNLRIPEIYKAFKMERSNELRPRYEHYQLYSRAYVSSVLIKYEAWKNAEYLKLAEIEQEYPVITEEEKTANLITLVTNVYNDSKINKVNLGANILYDRMDAKGLIDISTEEKKQLFDHVKKQMIKEEKQNAAGDPFNIDLKKTIEDMQGGKHNQNIKEQCRRLVVSKVMRGFGDLDSVLEILVEKREEKTVIK